MRIAAFTELNGPNGVTIQTVEDPTLSAGEAVVAVEGCSVLPVGGVSAVLVVILPPRIDDYIKSH